MPSCIVCHLDIEENPEALLKCPNEHPIHKSCLAEWLLHSQNCPLCSDPYLPNVINQFEDHLEQKEQERQAAIDAEKKKEDLMKMEELTNNIIFLKVIEEIELLIEDKQYEEAIDKLLEFYEEGSFNARDQKVLFLLGKANFLKGRFDLTINFLFKLVKQNFDYPDGFFYLGKAYEKLGLHDKAKWAFDRAKTK
ncbi:MAG: RING finger domain-containing protein [Promethearchaeota archaeon]|jgi:tetratricopeptide (TPR) repeat protein